MAGGNKKAPKKMSGGSAGPANGRMQNVPVHNSNRPTTDSISGGATKIVKKY